MNNSEIYLEDQSNSYFKPIKYSSEKRFCPELTIDPRFPVYQITQKGNLNQKMYMDHLGWTPDSKYLVFVSNRSGTNELFLLEYETGIIIQLTEKRNLFPLSWAIKKDGTGIIYFANNQFWEYDLVNYHEVLICENLPKYRNWTGGILSITPDSHKIYYYLYKGIYQYIPSNIFELDIKKKQITPLLSEEYEKIYLCSHVIVCPTNPDLIHFDMFEPKYLKDGPPQFFWLMNTDGSNLRPLYKQQRNIIQKILNKRERVSHESWFPNGKDFLFVQRRDKIKSIDINDPFGKEKVRIIAKGLNFWHPAISFDSTMVVSDTMWKDTGLWLIDVETGKKNNICLTKSDAVSPMANQISPDCGHPHPSFSPNNKIVAFNRYIPELNAAHIFACELTKQPFN